MLNVDEEIVELCMRLYNRKLQNSGKVYKQLFRAGGDFLLKAKGEIM